MARESQRYQVGLIICVMLLVILVAVSFFLWRSGNDLAGQLDNEKKRVTEAQQAQTNLSTEIQYLKAMLGAGETTIKGLEQSGLPLPDTLTEIKTQFDQDMKLVGAALPEDQHNYMAIVKNLFTSLNKNNELLAEAGAQVRAANDDRDRKVAEMMQRVNTAEEGRKTAEDTLAAERTDFNRERQEYIAQSQTNAQQIDALTTEKDKIQTAAEAEAKTYQDKVAALERQLQAKNLQLEEYRNLNLSLEEMERLRVESPFTIDSADGKIINVNQSQRSVWLNIGGADGLRSQATFTVFDRDATNAEAGTPKARIEVTRILGGHQAEARILEDKLANPIMRGDIIYSPAFRAGRKVHFALAGVIDLNDDGVSDRELVRNLISINGGEIDAEQLDDGTVSGAVSATTRYLVLGEQPQLSELDPSSSQKMLDGYSEINKSALAYGVKTLKVEEFLDLMGWKPEVESVNLGPRTSQEADESNAFRSRRPPTRPAEGSAFGDEEATEEETTDETEE